MATPYSIPRTLWESLDAILFAKGTALAREIAAELKVNPQPLLQSLNTQERGKFFLLPDEETTSYQCQATVAHGKIWMRCRCPVLSGARFCGVHEKSAPIVPSNLEEVERIEVNGDLYLKKADGIVLNRDGKVIGQMTGNQKLLIFDCED